MALVIPAGRLRAPLRRLIADYNKRLCDTAAGPRTGVVLHLGWGLHLKVVLAALWRGLALLGA